MEIQYEGTYKSPMMLQQFSPSSPVQPLHECIEIKMMILQMNSFPPSPWKFPQYIGLGGLTTTEKITH